MASDGNDHPGSPDERAHETDGAGSGAARGRRALVCPFDLSVDTVARLLNAEFPDHPVYDSFELQWFDDPVHGTGMLAFLSRRADRRVDYYRQRGLVLDLDGYAIGGGIGHWEEVDFEAARLEVGPEGVVAEVRFSDVDGRAVEVLVDDRPAGRRRGGELLAPVSAGIDDPVSLMLVVVRGFDLLRRAGPAPLIRIDGEPVSTGKLPGRLLHRRHLIKAGAPLVVTMVCRAGSRPLAPVDPADPGPVVLSGDAAGAPGVDAGIAGVSAGTGDTRAVLAFDPPLPPLGALPDGELLDGTWDVRVDDAVLTGGQWHARRRAHQVELGLDVTRRWRPRPGLPLLIRIVTRIVPVFRRWPTTYRWHATVTLDDPPRIDSRWERTGTDRDESERRATGG